MLRNCNSQREYIKPDRCRGSETNDSCRLLFMTPKTCNSSLMRDDVTNGRLPVEVKDRSSFLRFISSRYQRPFLRFCRRTLEMNHLMLIFYHISQLFTTPDVLFSFFSFLTLAQPCFISARCVCLHRDCTHSLGIIVVAHIFFRFLINSVRLITSQAASYPHSLGRQQLQLLIKNSSRLSIYLHA